MSGQHCTETPLVRILAESGAADARQANDISNTASIDKGKEPLSTSDFCVCK